MPRDYKGRAESGRTRSTACPVWFMAGLVLGVFLSGLVWLKFSPQGVGSQPAPGAMVPEPVRDRKKKAEVPPPRYDFYTLLPAQEVVVPQEEMSEPEPPPRPAAAGAAPVTESYVLQMGAFGKYSDADRLKAGLALLGVQAEIQRVSIDGKERFHRVRSGPYTRRQANELHSRLKANGIPGLVIKVSE